MSLTLEMFEQISKALRGDTAAGRDQRGQPRVGLRARAQITPKLLGDNIAPPIDVWIRDLSAGGMGLTANQSLPEGSTFTMTLASRSSGKVTLTFVVKRCSQASATVYTIGAELDPEPAVPVSAPVSKPVRRSA